MKWNNGGKSHIRQQCSTR